MSNLPTPIAISPRDKKGALYGLRYAGPVDAPKILFLHATGFNATTYIPFLDNLAKDFNVLALSMRGHGSTTLPTDRRFLTWKGYAEDIVEALSVYDSFAPDILVGHSMGAVVSMMLGDMLSLRPAEGKVAKVIAIEPVILPYVVSMSAFSPIKAFSSRNAPISRKVRGRRNGWANRQAFEEAYRSSSFFRDWDERAFDGYMDEGLVERDGQVFLACDPQWEADTFAAIGHHIWPTVRRLTAQGVGLQVLKAEKGSTLRGFASQRLAAMGIPVQTAKGSHLLVQERPTDVARLVHGLLSSGAD